MKEIRKKRNWPVHLLLAHGGKHKAFTDPIDSQQQNVHTEPPQ